MGSVSRIATSLLVLAMAAGCASTSAGLVAWPGPAPHPITLTLTGSDVDGDKRSRCEQEAREAGATLSDRAPVTVTLSLSSQNRLTISAGPNRVLLDEPQPQWSIKELCAHAMRKAAERYPTGTVQDFVTERVMKDPALSALLAGAGHAQVAFNMAAETPIDELEEGSDRYVELQKAVSAAQDAYRRYASYGRTLPASAFDTTGVRLLAGSEAEAEGKVRIQGTGAVLRVEVTLERITLLGIESDRGKTIVTFDGDMKATATSEFRPFLIGDRVDVAGGIKRRVKRGEAGGAAAPSQVVPAAAAGCAKDTDCKGDRVCEQGTCVSPPSRKSGK